MKIKNGEYDGDVEELLEFFEKTKIDVPSLLNAPREFKTHPCLLWISIVLYFLGVLGGYYLDEKWKFLMNIICLVSLCACCLLCYVRFRNKNMSGFIFIFGLIIYLLSTSGINNDYLKDIADRGRDKFLPIDTVSTPK